MVMVILNTIFSRPSIYIYIYIYYEPVCNRDQCSVDPGLSVVHDIHLDGASIVQQQTAHPQHADFTVANKAIFAQILFYSSRV